MNVSVTPYTFDETFTGDSSVTTKDNNKVSFAVHFVFRVKSDPANVQRFVERYTTMNAHDVPDTIIKTAYANFIKEPLRTFARNEVPKYDAMTLKEKIIEIGTEVDKNIKIWVDKDNAPFEVLQVTVGNLQLPESITTANANYVASEIELRRLKEVELSQQSAKLDITNKLAEIRKAEAKGIADAMTEINNKLTPLYLQYEAIKSQMAQISSPNHSVIYIHVGNMGVPLVGAMDMPGSASPVEKK